MSVLRRAPIPMVLLQRRIEGNGCDVDQYFDYGVPGYL